MRAKFGIQLGVICVLLVIVIVFLTSAIHDEKEVIVTGRAVTEHDEGVSVEELDSKQDIRVVDDFGDAPEG